jgi:hypothetical protein
MWLAATRYAEKKDLVPGCRFSRYCDFIGGALSLCSLRSASWYQDQPVEEFCSDSNLLNTADMTETFLNFSIYNSWRLERNRPSKNTASDNFLPAKRVVFSDFHLQIVEHKTAIRTAASS